MKEILDDLEKRELLVVTFIVEDKKGRLQLISYGEDGLVNSLSRLVDGLSINELAGNGMIYKMSEITTKKEEL